MDALPPCLSPLSLCRLIPSVRSPLAIVYCLCLLPRSAERQSCKAYRLYGAFCSCNSALAHPNPSRLRTGRWRPYFSLICSLTHILTHSLAAARNLGLKTKKSPNSPSLGKNCSNLLSCHESRGESELCSSPKIENSIYCAKSGPVLPTSHPSFSLCSVMEWVLTP